MSWLGGGRLTFSREGVQGCGECIACAVSLLKTASYTIWMSLLAT